MLEITRVTTPEQIADVASLAREIWTEHYLPIIGRGQVEYMLEKFQSAEAIAEQTARGYEYHLATSGGRHVGYIAVVPDSEGDFLHLSKIYVAKSARGHGIGRRMLERVEDECRRRGLKGVWLTVNKNNAGSLAWYGRMGFENVGPIRIDIGGGYVMDDYKMEKRLGALRGLIFDVDGVVADTEAVNAAVTIEVLAELVGLEGVRREDFEEGVGRGAAEYVRAAARANGVELTDEQVEAVSAARQERFLERLAESPLPPFPGVMELMGAALARDDFRVAIATSSNREKSESVLRAAGVPYDRMAYLTGSDVTHKKPHPELFLTAADRIGLAPGACVVIEDAPNGIRAALAAGCRCIAVTNTCSREKLVSEEPDLVVDSLAEVSVETVLSLLRG